LEWGEPPGGKVQEEVIFHISFVISHFSFLEPKVDSLDLNEKREMTNDRWKILSSVSSASQFPCRLIARCLSNEK
jgi:hypothetical protein